MKTSLKALFVVLAAAPLLAFANPKLVGTWNTNSGTERALPGVMEFHADGTAKLAPEGYAPMTGTWKETAPGTLSLEMPPHGVSEMTYSLKKNTLKLTYNTGAIQNFERQKTTAKAKKK